MECILDFEKLKGKTIKNVISLDRNEEMGLIFTDDTYCIIDAQCMHDSPPELFLTQYDINHESDIEYLARLGVITKQEYRDKQKQFRKNDKAKKETREREEYLRLKQKFDKGKW